jgi:lysosomal Pro-X carboxypeptidase
VAIPAAAATSGAARLSVLNCTEHWIGQELDHFSSEDSGSGNNPTWQQRTFVYDGFVPAGGAEVVFFYVGNEADVTLYVNASGLMWERAEEFGALLVWSEHRYYGESQPFGSVEQSVANKTYLSVEQALADHAKAAGSVRSAYNVPTSAATVAFGGSYGGMLATWLRLTRPDAVDGAVAASAPVLSFEAEVPPCDATFYAKGVSFDVSPAAGASAACSPALSRAFSGGGGSGVDDDSLPALGATAEGRATLTEGLRLCEGSLRNASGECVEVELLSRVSRVK